MQEKLVLIPILMMIGLGIFLVTRIKDLHKSDEMALLSFCRVVGPAAIVTGILLVFVVFS